MNDRGNIVIYQTKDGKTSIDVKLEDETVWLNQAQMAELFQKDRTVIGRHINNVYREGELERDITCAKFAHMGSYSDQQYETAVYDYLRRLSCKVATRYPIPRLGKQSFERIPDQRLCRQSASKDRAIGRLEEYCSPPFQRHRAQATNIG